MGDYRLCSLVIAASGMPCGNCRPGQRQVLESSCASKSSLRIRPGNQHPRQDLQQSLLDGRQTCLQRCGEVALAQPALVRPIMLPMNINSISAGILSGGATGAVISAIWNHFSKRSLQRQEAGFTAKLTTLEHDFQRSQGKAQAEIDRWVFVTRAHFETEFEAMKEVFSCLSEVKLAINGVRPMVSLEPVNETEEEKLKRLFERLETLSVAYNKLLVNSEARAPFYTAELYEAVGESLLAAGIEINSINSGGNDTFEIEWFLQGTQNRDKFSKGYSKAVESIRDRIAKLAILPGR